MIPNIIIPFYSDISIDFLINKSVPLNGVLWIHRRSFLSLLVISTAILMLLFRARYANYFSAVILMLLFIDVTFLIEKSPPGESQQFIERLPYNDPAYGKSLEEALRILFPALEILLIYSLFMSKRIREYYQ
jgi:hypothetical protein